MPLPPSDTGQGAAASVASPLLSTVDAASYLTLSPKTLERYRLEGTGPSYVKLGPGKRACVRYRKSDLDEWISAQVTTSTSAQHSLP